MNNDEIIRIARERIDDAYSADIDNREEAEDDLQNVIGNQWPERDRKAREEALKPCLTFNGLAQFVRQVTGQIRGINPAIKVVAADSAATDEVAEIYSGLIRQIETQFDASSIYEQAAESAAACGIGHWRIRPDYAEGDTFDQVILLERIHNPFAVFWDPLAKESSRADARFCFVVEEIDREDFIEQYPDAGICDITSDNRSSDIVQWSSADTVTVAEYFWIETEEHEIGLTAEGQIVRDPKPPMDFVKTRMVQERRVKWAKINGKDVLEGPQEVPCEFIPVVAVTGEEWHIGERMYRSSVVRYAKDAQRLYNFMRSIGAELTQMQPKAPYLVTADQVSGLSEYWNRANTANLPYLPYNPDKNAPPPQRVPPPVPSSAIMSEIQLAAEDMKRTTGIYDASLGAQSNETSGVAIARRQMESQNGTSVYADNMAKAITQTGRILVSMIPRVYDTQRVIRVLGEDDQEKQVLINAVMQNLDGQFVANDMTAGRYGVQVSVGPSFQTRRAEAVDGMMQFLNAIPQAGAVTADLIASMQDWPEADRIADRLRKVLPPGVADEDDMTPEQQQQIAMQRQQAQAEQQQVAQMQRAAAEADIRKKIAEAEEAEADAIKAKAEAEEARYKLAQLSGQFDMAMREASRQGFAAGAASAPQMGGVNPQGF